MIVYNVTISIDNNLHTDWLNWMKNIHIPNVMKTGCFTDFKICKIISTQTDETGITYAIQYNCNTLDDLNNYQTNYASKLQKEHTKKFNGKFVAFRTILEIIE